LGVLEVDASLNGVVQVGVLRAREGGGAIRRGPTKLTPRLRSRSAVIRVTVIPFSLRSPALQPMHHDGRLSEDGVRRRIIPLKKQRFHASHTSSSRMPLCPGFPLFLSACHVCPIVAVIGTVRVRRICLCSFQSCFRTTVGPGMQSFADPSGFLCRP
jgi:hypothetical protein